MVIFRTGFTHGDSFKGQVIQPLSASEEHSGEEAEQERGQHEEQEDRERSG